MISTVPTGGILPAAGCAVAALRQFRCVVIAGAALAGAAPLAAAEPPPQLPARPMLDAEAESHLRRGLEYFRAGAYASAIYEFETVLRLGDLPPTPHQQAALYAAEAEAELRGQRLRFSGYALLGGGNYAENDTEAGSAERDAGFFSARAGARANYQLSPSDRVNLSLDYRFRDYADQRDFHDLRWNANVGHNADDANVTIGVRGRASYRGDNSWRNDYGLFTQIRWSVGADDQLNFGAEVRRRDYPPGRERSRSRNIVEFSGGWNHALFDGKAGISLDAAGGLERATDDRIDGDSLFVSVSSTFDYSITDRFGGYVTVWWQNDAYNSERFDNTPGGELISIAPVRNDDLVEIGGGLTYELGRLWSLNADILWIRDYSNLIFVNYSSTELHLTLRKDF
jgi:hypothetical protein